MKGGVVVGDDASTVVDAADFNFTGAPLVQYSRVQPSVSTCCVCHAV